MTLRKYDAQRDRDAVLRICREVGWCTTEKHAEALAALAGSGRTFVAEIEGSVECMVTSDPGTIRHGSSDLPLTGITSVVTSRVARKRGLAGRLTARLLAAEAEAGAAVSVLGAFEQGYYNQLGFGNGTYTHWCSFDPSTLNVPPNRRLPIRLELGDGKRMHANRLGRLRRHGACSLDTSEQMCGDMLWTENGFGFGFVDEDGHLTHHMWCSAKDVEHGPYEVYWAVYRTKEQFHELLGLLRSLEEQVGSIEMQEPPGIQLQDLLRKPFKQRRITRRSAHENRMSATAYWQSRILDLPAAMARTSLEAEPVRFQLALSDPIADYCEADAPWKGVAGDYVVELGPESRAEPGTDRSLPTLAASVNAFSRMWLGVRSATSLSWTDQLSGPADLLARLDRTLRLPPPAPDWEF
jgi:predicted acetyltransferase